MKYILVPVAAYRRPRAIRLTPQNLEFGRASKSCQLIQAAFYSLTRECKDCRKPGLLTRSIYQAMQADPLHQWGERTLQDGDTSLLQGYDFNARKKLTGVLWQRVEAAINGVTGICSVTIPSFMPYKQMRYESEPTYVRFSIGAACIDFSAGRYNSRITRSAFLPMEKETAVKLMTMIDLIDEAPIFLVLGIEFFIRVNKQYLLLQSGGSMCLNIVGTGRGIVEEM